MKSELLNIITGFKDKNTKLRNNIINDYNKYTYLMSLPQSFEITLTEDSITVSDGDDSYHYDCLSIAMLKSILHTYLSRSILTGKNAYRYDIFISDDINSKVCEKMGYLEQIDKTTSRKAIVVCSSKKVASILKEELVVNFKYVSMNEAFEKILEMK